MRPQFCLIRLTLLVTAVGALAIASAPDAADEPSDQLATVLARETLHCGLVYQGPGLAQKDDATGTWQGFDVALCRALAAGVLGDPDAVTFSALSPETAQEALTAGAVDLLARAPDPGLSANRDGIAVAAISYHDGLGFMAHHDLDAINARELGKARLCVVGEARSGRMLNSFFERARIAPTLVEVEDQAAAEAAYREGSCDAYTGKGLALASKRLSLSDPQNHRVLPDILTKEPFGPLVRSDETRWLEVVRWTVFALLIAEELGVDRDNADVMRGTEGTAEARRLLGSEGEIGIQLGLDNDWAYRLLTTTGNYAEIFDRTVGPQGPLGLERGLNALWRDGGLMHAPALQ